MVVGKILREEREGELWSVEVEKERERKREERKRGGGRGGGLEGTLASCKEKANEAKRDAASRLPFPLNVSQEAALHAHCTYSHLRWVERK